MCAPASERAVRISVGGFGVRQCPPGIVRERMNVNKILPVCDGWLVFEQEIARSWKMSTKDPDMTIV